MPTGWELSPDDPDDQQSVDAVVETSSNKKANEDKEVQSLEIQLCFVIPWLA